MKVTNWVRKVAVAMTVAGIWTPSVVHAVTIPLGDPSFEAYTVPAGGYAYADTYRPTSAWIDDLDNPGSAYVPDNAASNWLYNTAYGEDGPPFRGAPRTGNQAMHGFYHYSGQKLTTTFAAGSTYTFSLWAQGDDNAVLGTADNVYLYLFDASAPFAEATSLTFHGFIGGTDFANRATSMTQAASQANWTKLNLSYSIGAGSPLIGKPIGVAFYAGEDAAVDDASLTSIPEPTTVMLVGMGGMSLLGLRRKRT
ncbi:MAG TPA: PEP-CTERM sorting domain-containing protein [Lacipirellulaceae bacterium]|nr:PEP-CTERM sorting domain-containing protein [Lacipirellulaceae bacterium]